VTEKAHECMVSCIGGAVGAAVAYMFFTNRGRQLRRSFEPMLEDLTRELNQFRGTISKAAGVAGEGWKLLNEAIGDTAAGPRSTIHPHQSSPF
jgi:gas vesicle protein